MKLPFRRDNSRPKQKTLESSNHKEREASFEVSLLVSPTAKLPLLRQLLSELSPSARASLSLPGDNALSATGGLAAGAAPPVQITQNNSNVSAPVTIQVRSTGADAGQVGQKLYDTAERYLLRTLQGIFA